MLAPSCGLRQRDRFAQLPHRAATAPGSRRPPHRSIDAALERRLEQAPRSSVARVRLAFGVGLLEQHGPRRRRQRLAQLREVRAHQVEREARSSPRSRSAPAPSRACASCSSATQSSSVAQRGQRGRRGRGLRVQLQRRRGDDAERAFAADEQVAQVVAGVVLAQAASGRPRPRRRRSPPRARGTARARCRSAAPACRRRWWRGCRRSCSCLRPPGSAGTAGRARAAACCTRLQHAAGLDGHRQVGRVDGAHAVHARAGSAAPACRCRRARQPPTRPVLPPCGDDRRAVRGAGAHDRGDLGGRRRAAPPPARGRGSACASRAPRPRGRRRSARWRRRRRRAVVEQSWPASISALSASRGWRSRPARRAAPAHMHGAGGEQHQAQQRPRRRPATAPVPRSLVARTTPSVKYSHTSRLSQR